MAADLSVQPDETAAVDEVPAEATTTVADDPEQSQGLRLLAHRGVHQTFDRDGVDDQTCTATRIDPPIHEYLENTIPSIEAAFAAGATIVEIDIAKTSDDVLAVFHDWTVDCRTEGTGDIRSFTWDELSTLDIGYGYTADGETYPLRGLGVGLMPRLEDVFEAFPEGQFLINFKSNDPSEAVLLQQVVEESDAADQVWAVYGAPTAVETYVSNTDTRGFSEETVGPCLANYAFEGDLASTREACGDTVLLVPLDIAPMLDGLTEFIDAMDRLGSEVVIAGANGAGIDTIEELESLPDVTGAYVWTNRVDVIG